MTDIKAYKDQVYQSLDEEHSSNWLFIDPAFPAIIQSISHTGKLDLGDEYGENILQHIEWRRPHEISPRPHFVIDGFQRRDLGQGGLGDCWFVAAASKFFFTVFISSSIILFDYSIIEL